MGQSSNKPGTVDLGLSDDKKDVDFDSFKILRSIGKGSFGKVCMVQKQNNGKLLAMKYLNKESCIAQNFVENVNQEITILRKLDHEYIVNLWYTFEDEEDFFIVVDLLLGGDLRYHMSKSVQFSEGDIRLYLMEMASVLKYLESKCIIHRDIKPDNILLDDKGHAHLTDFNIAVRLKSRADKPTGFAGTKPYIAPEICEAKLKRRQGYSFSVDWWSLAVTLYELLRHKRPFKISSDTTVEEAMDIYDEGKVSFSSHWSESLINLFLELFVIDGNRRLSSYEELQQHEFCSGSEMVPHFVPSSKHLNYDPTHELEEMMIEAKPLHKKKQRIKKQKESLRRQQSKSDDLLGEKCEETNENKGSIKFITFNRELEHCDPDQPLPG